MMKGISSREVLRRRRTNDGGCTRIFPTRTTYSHAHHGENTVLNSSASYHMIALLNYGSGNLRSVEKALRKVGADVRLVTNPEGMKDASAAVLPGVGAF